MTLRQLPGYLSNTRSVTPECGNIPDSPWKVEVAEGQTINLTLFEFTPSAQQEDNKCKYVSITLSLKPRILSSSSVQIRMRSTRTQSPKKTAMFQDVRDRSGTVPGTDAQRDAVHHRPGAHRLLLRDQLHRDRPRLQLAAKFHHQVSRYTCIVEGNSVTDAQV